MTSPPVLRYGGDADFAPYESLDAQGRPVGFQVDLMQALAAEMGMALALRLAPWPETEAAFRAGALDVVAMVQTDERRRWARFARSHAAPAFGIYHRRDMPPPQSLQELAGRRIAVLDRPAMNDTRRALLAGTELHFVPADRPQAALDAVVAGRADYALLLRAQAEPLRAAGTAAVAASSFSPRLQSYALAVAPDDAALLTRIEAGLAALERSGALAALRERWLYAERDAAERRRLSVLVAERGTALWALGGGSVLAVAGLAVALRRRGQRIARERTRRREADARAARAEALLSQTFSAHPTPMLVAEPGSACVRDANDAACRLFGLPREAVLDRPLATLAGPDPAALRALADGLLGGTDGPWPWRWTAADGGEHHGLVSAEPMAIDGRPYVFAMLRDVTEAWARDESMRRDEDALAAALAAAQRGRAAAEAARDEARGVLDEHVTVLSHDLRAPLRAVQGFNGLLRRALQAGRVDEALSHSAQIDRAAQRMEAMVGALSRVARAGQAALQRGPVDMGALAAQAWGLVRAASPGREIGFELAALPPADADAEQAALVWQNLLENAWKYTARCAAPRVVVDAAAQGGRCWYRVADNGVGFDMAHAGRLFQPFQRLHAAADFAGTGVGLSLVRRIVQRHGGDIRVRSRPGEGTVVEFTLDPPPA